MSKKIIGVTVGTTLPKPNFKQNDPTKGDYIKNKPDFDGLKDRVDVIGDLVGDTAVSTQISNAVTEHENKPIHITADERAKWDEAYEYAQGYHAPADAEKNQNAYGQIIVNNSVFSANNIESSLVFNNTAGITINAKVDTIDGKEVTSVEFDNAGVRSVETGSTNGTIKVNTGGTVSDVPVKGLGSAAYTESSAYDAAGAANTALESAKSYVDEKLLDFDGNGGTGNSNVFVQNDEPVDAPDGALWVDLDDNTTVGGGVSDLPPVSSMDEGKVLMVVNGEWKAVTIPFAEEVGF